MKSSNNINSTEKGSLTKEEKTLTAISKDDPCDVVKNELLEKYKQDYNSCFKETNTEDANCQKAGNLSDAYKENLNILVILDSSGSMAENISGGKKMDIAKKVITSFVEALPARAWVGLMVYGHKGSNAVASKALSCAGIEMVYPLSELNKTQFTTAVKSFQPTGYTPIADSLRKAKELLANKDPEKTTNIIYLVSDGIETCDGDPVAAAKELKDLKVQTIVNIVGFAVDGSAQNQLKAAAAAGGGEYYSANTAEEMDKVFSDRQKYLRDISDYRDCISIGAAKKRDEIQKIAVQIRNCLQTKAIKEREDMSKEITALKNSKEIDYNCWNNINDGVFGKWNKIHFDATDNWRKIYNAASSEWSAVYTDTYNNWSKEYYK